MPADKKIPREELPRPEKTPTELQNPEEFNAAFDNQSKPVADNTAAADKKKKARGNFSSRDLPIY